MTAGRAAGWHSGLVSKYIQVQFQAWFCCRVQFDSKHKESVLDKSTHSWASWPSLNYDHVFEKRRSWLLTPPQNPLTRKHISFGTSSWKPITRPGRAKPQVNMWTRYECQSKTGSFENMTSFNRLRNLKKHVNLLSTYCARLVQQIKPRTSTLSTDWTWKISFVL